MGGSTPIPIYNNAKPDLGEPDVNTFPNFTTDVSAENDSVFSGVSADNDSVFSFCLQ